MKATLRQPSFAAAWAIVSGDACVGQRVDFARFADIPVLAELAAQVAAGRAERQHRRAGQKMVERLFLDRVDAITARPAVSGEHDLLILAGAHEAEAPLPFVQLAITRTHVALHAAVVERMPIPPGDNRLVDQRHGLLLYNRER